MRKEGRKQKAGEEVRSQSTDNADVAEHEEEVRSQESEDRSPEPEVGEEEVRSQETEVRSQETEATEGGEMMSVAQLLQQAPFAQMGAKEGPGSPPPTGPIRVEVLFAGSLGPKLLTKGDITDDPDYVKLLTDRRGLVKLVE